MQELVVDGLRITGGSLELYIDCFGHGCLSAQAVSDLNADELCRWQDGGNRGKILASRSERYQSVLLIRVEVLISKPLATDLLRTHELHAEAFPIGSLN